MSNESLSFFLFPHLNLSEKNFRNFYMFLPRLYLLEILHPPEVPEWGEERFISYPVAGEGDFRDRIASCLRGYHDFAQVHEGGGGTLGFLSQVMDNMTDSRFQIQDEIRGKHAPEPDIEHKELFRGAVFLEIARELDEKELELEASYTQLEALEKEFRDILGIAEGEEAAEAEAALSPPLVPDMAGSQFMLPRRIESWFRLFAAQPPESTPVFVANHPGVIDETLELVRAKCSSKDKTLLPVRFPLGSFPRLDRLGRKQFRSLIDAPGLQPLLDSYWQDLKSLIKAAGTSETFAELPARSEPLKHHLGQFCRNCELPTEEQVNLSLVCAEDLLLSDILESLGAGIIPDSANRPVSFICID